MKLLFNGTRSTNPEVVLSSEYGLDNRFAREGFYGTGIYFADNAHYVNDYSYTTPT